MIPKKTLMNKRYYRSMQGKPIGSSAIGIILNPPFIIQVTSSTSNFHTPNLHIGIFSHTAPTADLFTSSLIPINISENASGQFLITELSAILI